MSPFALLVGYLVFCALILMVFLFGELPAFRGTPIAKAHWFITNGLCQYSQGIIKRICGQWAVDRCGAFDDYFFNRPNPYFQIIYLGLQASCFFFFQTKIFIQLPLPGIPAWHIWTGTATVCTTLWFFMMASITDAGAITKENVEEHLSLYDYDGVCFEKKKRCETCGIQRPARAKHDRVLNVCVARYDHFCPWINNAIGIYNARYFYGFLLSNAVMCGYGAALVGAIMWHKFDIMMVGSLVYFNYRKQQVERLIYSPGRFSNFLLARFPFETVLLVVTALVTLLMLCFAVYHMLIAARNITTYETHKRREWQWRQQVGAAEIDAPEESDPSLPLDEPAAVPADKAPVEGAAPETAGDGVARETAAEGAAPEAAGGSTTVEKSEKVPLPPHAYDRGLLANAWEVIYPEGFVRQRLARASAAKKDE